MTEMKGMIYMKELKRRIRKARWENVGNVFAMIGLSLLGVFGIFIDGAAAAHEQRMSWLSGRRRRYSSSSMAEDLFDSVSDHADDFQTNRSEIKDLKEEIIEKQVEETKENISNSNYSGELATYLKTLITKCSYLDNKEQKRFLLSIKKVLAKYAEQYKATANTINGPAMIEQKIMARLAIIEQALNKRLIKEGYKEEVTPTKKMSI